MLSALIIFYFFAKNLLHYKTSHHSKSGSKLNNFIVAKTQSPPVIKASPPVESLSTQLSAQLLALQKTKPPYEAYAMNIDNLVASKQLSQKTADKILSQYRKQQTSEMTQENILGLQQLAKMGALTEKDAQELIGMLRETHAA